MRRLVLIVGSTLALSGCVAGCDLRIVTTPAAPSTAAVTPTETPPPLITSFTADATRLNNVFLDTFLRWDVTGSSDTRCRIDTVGTPGQNIGNVPLAGFTQVRPGFSRDYLLTCTNRGGTVVRLVSILVG